MDLDDDDDDNLSQCSDDATVPMETVDVSLTQQEASQETSQVVSQATSQAASQEASQDSTEDPDASNYDFGLICFVQDTKVLGELNGLFYQFTYLIIRLSLNLFSTIDVSLLVGTTSSITTYLFLVRNYKYVLVFSVAGQLCAVKIVKIYGLRLNLSLLLNKGEEKYGK